MTRVVKERQVAAAVLLAVVLISGADPAPQSVKRRPFEVTVVGKGRPMILIPGLMCSGRVWDSTVEHYKGNFECHVLTLAGFAGQPPIAGPYLDTVRQGIAEYIRAKHLEKPVIVGHSLGGHLVFALGARDPDIVGPLIAVDGLPCLAAAFNDKVDAASVKKQADAMRQQIEKQPREKFLAQSKVMARGWATDQKQREAIEKWVHDSDQATAALAMCELFSTDLRPEIDRIKTPVLLLGAWSKETGRFGMKREQVTKRYEDQLANVPQHKVAMAENANHFIMLDAPDWMLAQIDAFLAEKR